MDAEGSNPVRLTDNPAYDAYPAWSPDGTRIAFASDRYGNDSEIYVRRRRLEPGETDEQPGG